MQITRKTLIAAAISAASITAAQAADTPLIDNYSTSVSGISNGSSSALNIGSYTDSNLWIKVSFTIGNFTPSSDSSATANNWPDFATIWLDDDNLSSNLHTDAPNIGLRGQLGTTGDTMIRLSSSAVSTFAGSALNAGDSFTILAHLYKDAGSSSYNQLEGWFNPASNAASTPTTFKASLTAGSGLSSISYIGVRSNLGNSDTVTVNSLSVGSTLASVSAVPEASSLAMLLAGLGMMGIIARRRIG